MTPPMRHITEEGIPHSIYECEGARTCAIQFAAFQECGLYRITPGLHRNPEGLKEGEASLHDMWARAPWDEVQWGSLHCAEGRAAVYSEEGRAQLKEQVAYYLNNARTIFDGLKAAGYTVAGV